MVVPAFLLSTGTRSKAVPDSSLLQSPAEMESSESTPRYPTHGTGLQPF